MERARAVRPSLGAAAALILNAWHLHTAEWARSSRPPGGCYHYNMQSVPSSAGDAESPVFHRSPPASLCALLRRAQYASLVRIAFAHCRLHLRDEVSICDALVGIALTEQSHATRAFSLQSAEQLHARSAFAGSNKAAGLEAFTCTGFRAQVDGGLALDKTVASAVSNPVRTLLGWTALMQTVLKRYEEHIGTLREADDRRRASITPLEKSER